MDYLGYRQGHLTFDGQSVAELADRFGTPLYVYSQACIEAAFRAMVEAMQTQPERLFYGVKANSNLAVLRILAKLGAGFDVVSGGELERVYEATGNTAGVVFSGVGKTPAELRRSLELGIRCFSLESESELELLSRLSAQMKVRAPVSLRVNPDVDADTHPYITTGLRRNKFGIDRSKAIRLYERVQQDDYLEAVGISCHIGSQIASAEPLLAAAQCLLEIVDTLASRGIKLRHMNLGGGFGICYRDEEAFDFGRLQDGLAKLTKSLSIAVFFEPGRSLVAEAGLLVARVLYTKENGAQHFTVVDAAMNDLLRPALYQAWHEVLPECEESYNEDFSTNLVGPVCESGDFLALQRRVELKQEDLVALRHAGAYGFVMSSNYNSRPRAAEVLIDSNGPRLIRRREELADLLALERLP